MTKGSKKPNPLPTTTVHVKLADRDIRRLAEYSKAQRPPCAMNALLRWIVEEWIEKNDPPWEKASDGSTEAP